MKIDQKLDPPAVSIGSTERAEVDGRSTSSSAIQGRSSDAVELSPDAQLLHRALKAATDGPAVRSEKVEDARRRLATGELGRDANALADRIIDHLLES